MESDGKRPIPSLEERLSTRPIPYAGEHDTKEHRRIKQHLEQYFGVPGATGVSYREWVWPLQGAREPYRGFRVVEIPPNARTSLWTYCSIGGYAHPHASGGRHEFFLLTERPNESRCTELLTMLTGYNEREGLGVGHTLPLDEPWVRDATCTSLLISVPYPFGPELEVCPLGDEHAHILWALPITEAERRFRHEQSLDALESRFESSALEYWDVRRRSVV